MNKKLEAKIQKLVPVLGENEKVFSSSIAIEPPEKELVLKKGCIYAAFDVSSPVALNVSLISRVVNDVLYDSYYHSENISPIQSLEKAIVDINDKVSSLIAQEVSTLPPHAKRSGEANFNIVAGVLWGNVMYMVQYGEGKSFLMREGEVKKVNSTSEGNFSVASGVVKDGDVIILNTKGFADKYPPQKLLDSSLSSNDLEPSFSSILLKFSVDEEFSEDESINFGVKTEKKTGKLKGMFQSAKEMSSKKDQSIESLVDKPESAPPSTPPASQDKKKSKKKSKQKKKSKIKSKKEGPNIKLKSKRGARKINIKTLTIFVSILLVLSVVATLIIRNNRMGSSQSGEQEQTERSSLFVPKEFNKNKQEETQPQEQETQPQEEEPAPEPSQDAIDKIARVDVQPFYDIKLADENANPTEIITFSNTLAVVDSESGKIFTSSTETPKFLAEEQAFPGVKTAENYEGNLNFADDENYKVYNLANSSLENSYNINTNLASRYLDNIYSIEDGQIIKYVPSGDSLESSVWAEDEAPLTNAKDMVVSYSIYVITAQNDLVVYTSGAKTNFSINGLDQPLGNVTGLATSLNFENIYIADSDNNRVVVINKDGDFVKQIKAAEDSSWSDIRNISVSVDENTLYLLNGSKVYEVDLNSANPPLEAGPEPEEDVEVETDSTSDQT